MQDTQLHWLKRCITDHHPGNYLFRPDGGIGLVDFGSVKRFTFEISKLMQCYLDRTWQKGETAARHFLKLLFGPKVPYKRAAKYCLSWNRFCRCFFTREIRGERSGGFPRSEIAPTRQPIFSRCFCAKD